MSKKLIYKNFEILRLQFCTFPKCLSNEIFMKNVYLLSICLQQKWSKFYEFLISFVKFSMAD